MSIGNRTSVAATSGLLILHCGSVDEQAQRLAKIVEMVGIIPVLADASELSLDEIRLRSLVSGCGALASSTAALALLAGKSCDSPRLEALLASMATALVYGFRPGVEADSKLLRALAGSAAASLVKPDAHSRRVSFAEHLPTACSQLNGASFDVPASAANAGGVFEIDPATAGWAALISRGELPLLACLDRQEGQLFLLASCAIPDVDAPVAPDGSRSEDYLALAPWLVFLRCAFGDACWHNPNPRAVWIIDDPLLRPRYGFLRYRDLAAAMDTYGFSASVAFIPWNHRRSARATVELFRARGDRLSLCVHGSDHTEGEFRFGDEQALRRKAMTALLRMAQHRAHTGLDFASVMVFPQGGFNKAALRALSDEGFQAVINSSVFADDWRPGDLTYRDLLDVAVTSYEGCPLFSRRYPTALFPILFDLFIGKPALIVEHHGYFKSRCEAAGHFSAMLNRQDENLKWTSVEQIVAEAALWKRVSEAELWIRFYSDDFSFRNNSDERITYRLHRKLPRTALVRGFMREGGRALDFAIRDSVLTAELALDRGEEARLRIVREPQPATIARQTSVGYQVKVALRRSLSEFRDNYIARSNWLLANASRLKSYLQLSLIGQGRAL